MPRQAAATSLTESPWRTFVDGRLGREARRKLKAAMRRTFHATEPTTVVVIGDPGSGKSTLVRILQRALRSLGYRDTTRVEDGPSVLLDAKQPLTTWRTADRTTWKAEPQDADFIVALRVDPIEKVVEDYPALVTGLDLAQWLVEPID